MKKLRTNRIWQIAYPIVAYYLLYHCFHILFLMLFGKWLGTLECLALSSGVTLLVVWNIYRSLPVVKGERTRDRVLIGKEIGAIAAVVVFGILLNIIISNTPLAEISQGYREANAALFSGSFWIKVLANGILIPVLEEVVYRGIVCSQLDLWYGRKISVAASAFLFGIMHFNVVQFLYAFLMGLALGYVYTAYKKLWIPIAAHGIINIVVVFVTALG